MRQEQKSAKMSDFYLGYYKSRRSRRTTVSLKFKTLARQAGDPSFDSRLWHVLIFSIFPDEIKCFCLHQNRRNPSSSKAIEYIVIFSFLD